MLNTKFEAYKLNRELVRSGTDFVFTRQKLNEFNEPDGEAVEVGEIRGLYHEQNSNIQITTSDATQIRTKKIPSILCLFEDVEKLSLKAGDKTTLNDQIFEVTGVVNIMEWSIVVDISLELVDYGDAS